MLLKRILYIAFLVVLGVVGFYLVFSSDFVPYDPFTIVSFLVVVAFLVYMFLFYTRNRE